MLRGRKTIAHRQLSFLRTSIAAITLLAVSAPLAAQSTLTDDRTITAIKNSAGFRKAARALDSQHDRFVDEIIIITEIPAPPFGEARRGEKLRTMFAELGLTNIEVDAVGNVIGLRRGTSAPGGKAVVVSAHLDTVFPEGTDVKVRREGTRLYAPGVADDSRGLAAMLAYVRALDAGGIRTRHDLLFVATVGEEGQGDLRGVRHFFTEGKYKDRIAAFYSIDSLNAATITNGAVGSKRYRVTFNGPGGHSFGSFGLVNPMTAMARSVAELYEIVPPAKPKTTYSASVTGGGTSVNSIPNSVFMEFDMRSEGAAELDGLEKSFHAVIDKAVAAENAARSTSAGTVTADKKKIGDRPAGMTAPESAIVRMTSAAARALGYTPSLGNSSTDANIPISLGIPAVTIGSGGAGGRAHSTDEYIDVEKGESVRGLTVGLLAILAVAGTE